MSPHRDLIAQAHDRGITLHLDDAGNLRIGGEYTDQFIRWATHHKAELVGELRKSAPSLDALLDQARTGTDFSIEDCRTLFSPLDLQLIVTGELTMEAAQHFLRSTMRRERADVGDFISFPRPDATPPT